MGEGKLSRIEEGIRENKKSKQRVIERKDRAESRTEEADKWWNAATVAAFIPFHRDFHRSYPAACGGLFKKA